MGVTRFPYGISIAAPGGTEHYPVGSTTENVKTGALQGTVITGGGTISPASFGLTAATSCVASLGGTSALLGTAAGIPYYVKSSVSGGSVVVRTYDTTATQATAAGTVNIIAYGT